MNQRDRLKIEQNIEKLIKRTNYEPLVRGCIQKGIITEDMRRIIEESTDSIDEQHRKLLIKITKRGPDAYENFKEVLNKLNYINALNALDATGIYDQLWNSTSSRSHIRDGHTNNNGTNEVGDSSINNNINVDITDRQIHMNEIGFKKLIPYTEIPLNLVDVKNNLINTPKEPQIMGVFFLVNYTEDRANPNLEKDYLLNLFKGLKYELIFYCEDPTYDELNNYIKQLKSNYFKNYSIRTFVYCHLGLCKNETLLFKSNETDRTNYSHCTIQEFMDTFNNANCSELLAINFDNRYYPDTKKIFIFPSVYNIKKYLTNSIHIPNLFAPPLKFESQKNQNILQSKNTDKPIPTQTNTLYFYFEKDDRDNSFMESIKNFCDVFGKYGQQYSIQILLKHFYKNTSHLHSLIRESSEYGFNELFCIVELKKKNE